MITEDYVSFETAKLLKEKGFDERNCNTCYKYNGKFCNNRKSMSGVDTMISFPAPTLQMAMKWLRQIYKIEIVISPSFGLECKLIGYTAKAMKHEVDSTTYIKDRYDTHEEACEAAIKYCLQNLI